VERHQRGGGNAKKQPICGPKGPQEVLSSGCNKKIRLSLTGIYVYSGSVSGGATAYAPGLNLPDR
jgi:hypothetical protein